MNGLSRGLRAVPTDLVLVSLTVPLATLALLPWVTTPGIQVVMGGPLLVFAPGYALVATMWPARSQVMDQNVSGMERVGLSIIISSILITVAGMALNAAAVSLSLAPILTVAGFVTVAGVATGTWRRRELPPPDRFELSLPWRVRPLVAFWPETRIDWVLLGCLILALGITGTSIGVAMAGSPAGESYTSFYLLTPNGSNPAEMADYPTVGGNDLATLVVGVENNEGRTISYTIVVERQVYAQRNDGLASLEERELHRFQPSVAAGRTWESEHQIPLDGPGRPLRITYLLYRGSPPSDPSPETAYRTVSMWIGNDTASESGPNG